MRDSPPYPPSFQISIARYERYGLRGVMGPDEPHEWVDDNPFTNAMARWNSEAALDALGWLWHSPPADEGEHAR